MNTSRQLEGRGAFVLAICALALAAALAACGSTSVTPEPDPDPVSQGVAEPGVVMTPPPDASQVEVTLTEWAVQPAQASVPGGPVYFLAHNVGQEPHELVVIKSDLAPEELPMEDGRVPEDAIDLIGEIEPFAADSSGSTVLDLEPGSYVLICNILETEDDGTQESHYEQGMRVAFAVE